MVNYAGGFNQSETGKYFEWMMLAFLTSLECAKYKIDFFNLYVLFSQ